MTISEGEPYTLRKVQLAGDLLDLNTELESMLIQKPGEVFNASKARETVAAIKNRLGELGYAFATVTPNPVTIPGTTEADLTFLLIRASVFMYAVLILAVTYAHVTRLFVVKCASKKRPGMMLLN